MNGDLISRETALDKALRHCRFCGVPLRGAPCDGCIVDAISGGIKQLPAVDAVEVVRCGDCMWRGNERKCPMCWTEYYDDPDDGADMVFRDNTTDDGFCHCGERAGGEEDGDA